MPAASLWLVLLSLSWLPLCKGDFLLEPQSVTKNLGETLRALNSVGYTLNLLFIQFAPMHFLTLWWEAANAFVLKLQQNAWLLFTRYADSLMELVS